ELPPQRGAADAEALGGALAASIGPLEGGQETFRLWRQRRRRFARAEDSTLRVGDPEDFIGQLAFGQRGPLPHHERVFDGVLELANVPGPCVLGEAPERSAGDSLDAAPSRFGV